MEQDSDFLKQFGARIRKLRKQQALSQEAFASLCTLDRTYVSGVERGIRNISLLNLRALANGLGVSLSELMEGL